MNTERIKLRALNKKDYKAVENIIRQTWHYDDICHDKKAAAHMARLYLRSCLKEATYTCVAEKDGQLLGLILGKSMTAPIPHKIRATLSQAAAIITLLSTKNGRKLSKMFGSFSKIDAQLLKSTGRQFDGEICLFAVTQAACGHGIGKKLFKALESYMHSQHTKSLYLFTDTTCTYQFYENQGMTRLTQKTLSLPAPINYKLDKFVYAIDFPT